MADKEKWLNIISKLNNEFSQLLYIISYLEEINLINYEQKIFLKKLLLINPRSLISLLNKLKESENIQIFFEHISKLILKENTNDIEIINIDKHKEKHLISISSNSWNEEITKDENITDNYI